jgi:hypothetical protein
VPACTKDVPPFVLVEQNHFARCVRLPRYDQAASNGQLPHIEP